MKPAHLTPEASVFPSPDAEEVIASLSRQVAAQVERCARLESSLSQTRDALEQQRSINTLLLEEVNRLDAVSSCDCGNVDVPAEDPPSSGRMLA